MWFRAGLTRAEFTLLPRSGPAGRTTDSKYPLGARFFLHKKKFPIMGRAGLVSFERFSENSRLIEVQGLQ
jgi:hypothetical protein